MTEQWTVTSNTNQFVNPIEGVTIDAKDVHEVGEDSTISVSETNSAARSALSSFVESYNAFTDIHDQLGGVTEEGGAGPLVGDSLLRGAMTSIRRSITESFTAQDGTQLSLSQVGVESDQYGKLSFDSSTFDDLADENPQALEDFFVGVDSQDGFAANMSTLVQLLYRI